MDALLRRRLMIASGIGIPYIRGGADGSYIDTGITADNTVKVIIWARNWNPQGGFLFGSRQSASVDSFGLGTFTGQNTGKIRIDYGNTQASADNQFTNLSHYHKYEFYQGVLKVDDVTIASATSATFSNSYNIHLFGMNTGDTHTNMSLPLDIFACKIYKNDVLVRDFTAKESPSAGLYDAVSDTLFTNAGSSSFTYGTFNLNAYIPLEYISASGGQWFDSGVKGTDGLPIVAKFRPTATTQATRWLLGGRTSSSSKRCDFQVGSGDINKTFKFGYQSDASTIYDTLAQTGNDLVWVKSNNTSSIYKGGSQLGVTVTGTAGSFETDYNIYVGGLNNAGTSTNFFQGYIYYAGFGTHNYVPAKVNGVAGMWDTYNDVFKPSASGTDFISGPEL